MIKTGYNKIESIEQLQFMNMPLLERLSLCKTFDKSDWKQDHKRECPEQVCMELLAIP